MKFTIEIELDDNGWLVHKRDAQGKIIFNYEQFCAESYAMLASMLGASEVAMLRELDQCNEKNHIRILIDLIEAEHARVFPSED